MIIAMTERELRIAIKGIPRWVHLFTHKEDPLGTKLKLITKDVIAIIRGKRYPPRGNTEEHRSPEDISTDIARMMGIDAYSRNPF